MKNNVLFIMTDQQQSTAMGCADSSFVTPNIDRLAASGIRFTSAISTSAQCTPSRAALQTGRYPHQLGVNQIGHVLDPGDTTVGQAFADEGYETAYFGKWHLGPIPLQEYGYEITDYRTEGADFQYANEKKGFHSYNDSLTTQMALNYLQDIGAMDREQRRPFFLTVSWYMPHPNAPEDGPFETIEAFASQYPEEQMPVPASYHVDDLSTKPSFQQERAGMAECSLSEETVRRDAAKYRTMVSAMDAHLGRLLDELERQGLAEQTVIVFTSDHGDMQGAHRLRLKGVLPYKELYGVPLLMRLPDASPAVVDRLVSTAAVPGTLIAAAGLDVPPSFEGGSLMEAMRPHDTGNEEVVFFEHYKAYWGYHPFRGIQTDRWKYVYYYVEDEEEMYDLHQDPDELCSIHTDPAVVEVKQKLRSEVDAWWQRTGALTREPMIDPTSRWGLQRGKR